MERVFSSKFIRANTDTKTRQWTTSESRLLQETKVCNLVAEFLRNLKYKRSRVSGHCRGDGSPHHEQREESAIIDDPRIQNMVSNAGFSIDFPDTISANDAIAAVVCDCEGHYETYFKQVLS